MKLLLAAYACEPGKGSEPMVGWRWATEIQKLGHQVWVITRANNKDTIDAFENEFGTTGIRFVYYDLPRIFRTFKRLPGGIYPYYYLWQMLVFFVARQLHQQVSFDRVHQLTFVSIRFPTFLGFLGAPLWIGPLGGGERSPKSLRWPLGWRFTLREYFRDLLIHIHALDPFRAISLTQAEVIFATTEESRQALPWWLRKRVRIQSAVACDELETKPRVEKTCSEIKLLYAGLHKDWKGLRLGLRALAIARLKGAKSYHLTIVGRGPDHQRWRQEVERLGLNGQVQFIDWLPRSELLGLYSEMDALLYPSMHDSGGFVVLESMANGLPVICLDCGGPGLFVTSDAGHVQPVTSLSYDEVIAGLADGLLDLQSTSRRKIWSEGAKIRALELNWQSLVHNLY